MYPSYSGALQLRDKPKKHPFVARGEWQKISLGKKPVSGKTSIVACFSLLIGSFVVPALTKNDTFDQWRTVFLIYAFVLTLSNTIFIAFARRATHICLKLPRKLNKERKTTRSFMANRQSKMSNFWF
ncbi:hypothetical protein NECAME_17592 [Necator americanus]|uniref:Uncharacterized protein n=1 Tax=Necator americanus TaxID=51031 RepID=W2TMG3_NECAM|nr:hypothetical protein NECAME_17592 [Necator americanus]ETN82958.1 hypothetical protein NECAME_17592 [Necator americanus]